MGYVGYEGRNQDIINDRKHIKLDDKNSSVKKTDIYFCQYCDAVFEKLQNLNSHIRNNHNSMPQLLRINGKVVKTDIYVSVSKLDSAVIIPSDISNAVLIDNKTLEFDPHAKEVDITEQIRSLLSSNNSCIIAFEPNIEIQIHSVSPSDINIVKLSIIIDNWEQDTKTKKMISRNYSSDFNEAEHRYLDGFYNYYLACNALGIDKQKRYDEAQTILNEFSDYDTKSRYVLMIIAFRRNCVKTLLELCENTDCFKNVCSFYCNFESCYNKDVKACREYQNTIYVEDDVELCIHAIDSLVAGDVAYVDDYLRIYENIELIEDVNLKDRVLLIMAKRAEQNGDRPLVDNCFDEIKSPCFLKDIIIKA